MLKLEMAPLSRFPSTASEHKTSTGQLPEEARCVRKPVGWKVQGLGEAIPDGDAVPFSPRLVLPGLPEKGIIYFVPNVYENSLVNGLWGSSERVVQNHVVWRGPRKEHDMDKA